MIKNIWVALISLIVAAICWLLSKFIVTNFVIGIIVNHGTDDSRIFFSSIGGFLTLGLWLFMLWAIRKTTKRKLK